MSVILIADDNPHAHRMGQQILGQEGYEVHVVSTGDEALEYLANKRPELILADTRMPGPTGFAVCRHVKNSPALDGVKVALLAGPLDPFDPAEAESAGADAVLHKPLDAFTLVDTVRSLIGAADGAAAPQPAPAARAPQPFPVEPLPENEAFLPADDPFVAAVEEALGRGETAVRREERIREAVREALSAAMPGLVEAVTRQVLQKFERRN